MQKHHERHAPYTAEDVREHIANGHVTWRRAGELLEHIPEECVDGRCGTRPVIGMPGGNAGEFVLMLAAVEKTAGKKFTKEEVGECFARFNEHVGSFYMHTDGHALHTLQQAILRDPHFAFLEGNMQKADALILKGSEDEAVRAKLLRHLTHPEHIGCGHLKLMLQEAETYGARREIVEGMMEAFFRALWKKEKNIEYFPLDGEHKERAVIVAKVGASKIDGTTPIPAFDPSTRKGQAFVYHPQAATFVREQFARHMRTITGLADLDLATYTRTIEALGAKGLAETLHRLARGKPVFTVTFQSDGKFTVEGGEKVA